MIWVGFLAFIVLALVLDLDVFNKNPHVISTKEASIWSAVWVACALLFSGVIYFAFAHGWTNNPTNLSPMQAVTKFITGYLIELSLSVDNIFVIAMIFGAFAIPEKYRHEVLFYGVLGAIVFRAIMIIFGVALITKFSWVIYIFGAFLIYTGVKMLFHKEEKFDPETSKMYGFIRRIFPVTHEMDKDKFFIKKDHKELATPLFVALIIIELSDIIFAVDSIPAVLAISEDPFIVFSSNILAVMGLRSMFFMISGMLSKFRYINYSLVAILTFVGLKMIFSHFIELPEWASLGFIVVALGAGIAASLMIKEEE